MIYITRAQMALRAIKKAKATIMKTMKWEEHTAPNHFIIKISDNPTIYMSIQCADMIFEYMSIRSPYFAETALQDSQKTLFYDKSLGYEDVRLWKDDDKLAHHIKTLIKKFKSL